MYTQRKESASGTSRLTILTDASTALALPVADDDSSARAAESMPPGMVKGCIMKGLPGWPGEGGNGSEQCPCVAARGGGAPHHSCCLQSHNKGTGMQSFMYTHWR